MGARPSCGILCVLLALAVGACSSKTKDKPRGKKSEAVAKLSKMKGTVDHRPAKTLTWNTATQGMALFHRDALKTGKASSLSVTFTTGMELELEERSLVVIEAQPKLEEETDDEKEKKQQKPAAAPRVARLEQGTMRGVAKPGAPAVQVVTPDGKATEIRAKGTEEVPFRIRAREGGKLEVAVLKGTAEVSTGDKRVEVKPRHVVDVSAREVSQPVQLLPYPELEAPPVDAKVVAGSEMELRWVAVEGAAMYRVQISHEVSFGERLHDTTVVGAAFRLPAPKSQRTYVWRVSTVDPAGRESEFGFARRFHVTSASKPATLGQLLSPTQNAGIQYVGQPRPVTFRWQAEGKSFTLVVARHPSLKKLVVARRRTQGTSVQLDGLGRGVYYWGVYVGKGKGRRPIFGEPHKLVVARRLPPYVKVPKAIDWK